MGFVSQLLLRPRKLWLRRANFQVHLWLGIALAIYVSVIGITGSMLVFGAELQRVLDPNPWPGIVFNGQPAKFGTVIENLGLRYPHTHIVSLTAPTAGDPVFTAVLQRNGRTTVACDPGTGRWLGEIARVHSRLDWVYELHENLFARRTGRVLNGMGAAALILLAVTGLCNWWPGIPNWRRAMRVDFRRGWKRINYDLHSAAGFWSVGLLLIWACSGVYFAWPAAVLRFVDRLSPIVNSRPPAITIGPSSEIVKLDFDAMVAKAHSLGQGRVAKSMIFPASRRSPLQLIMSRSPGIGRDSEDTLYFNPYTGQYIATWHYGVNRSLSDWFLYLQIPLHFGTHWGLAVKCLWAAFGLSLPLLSTTGLLLYWNRVLGKKRVVRGFGNGILLLGRRRLPKRDDGEDKDGRK